MHGSIFPSKKQWFVTPTFKTPIVKSTFSVNVFKRLNTLDQIADRFEGSSHRTKRRSRPFWGVLHMERNGVADRFGGSSH